MTSQKAVFLSGEGDAWFERNRPSLGQNDRDPVVDGLLALQAAPKSFLEIGCGEGRRLSLVQRQFGAECYGVEPSAEAVDHARKKYPGVTFHVGTADRIDLPDASVDVLVFGFCLYLADPNDYFRIAAEADRVLKDGGLLAIIDFSPKHIFKNPYSHKPGIFAHKMDFSQLFTWNPAYRLVSRRYMEHGSEFTFEENESVCLDFLKKDAQRAFPTSISY